MAPKQENQTPRGQRLRSRLWFDNPDNPADDLALSRALSQFRSDQGGADLGQADHRHRADRLRPVAVQSPPPRARQARARGHSRRRRRRLRVPDASDPGNRQAADRGARPQPRLSQPGRGAVRLSARRRRAHHRLRQDHAGGDHGGGDREHSGDRALGRADAQRLVEGRARGLRHRRRGRRARITPPAASTTTNSSTSSRPRRRRSAIATPWARPRR